MSDLDQTINLIEWSNGSRTEKKDPELVVELESDHITTTLQELGRGFYFHQTNKIQEVSRNYSSNHSSYRFKDR